MTRSTGTVLPNDPTGSPWLTVSSPLLPDTDDFLTDVRDIFERRWLTNQGTYARRLEAALRAALGVEDAVLLTNGTIAIELMVRSLLDGGEVIVPAYSFPATWSFLADNPRYTPSFVDIGEDYQIDPAAVEAAITPRTTGILAVHVYGLPANHEVLLAVARRHNLALMYDAAHAFGVTCNGTGIGNLGDLSSFSFHATKVFNTLEGGCVTAQTPAGAARVAIRRNFGLAADETQQVFGTNGKMDEIRAAFGLRCLPLVSEAITSRARLAARYRELFDQHPLEGIRLPPSPPPGVQPNWSYFPVRIPRRGARNRDTIDDALKQKGILARRYFSSRVFCSPLYDDRLQLDQLPRTRRTMEEVLCLPLHHVMTDEDVETVVRAMEAAW